MNNDKSDAIVLPPKQNEEFHKHSNVELIKSILDFISKSFYPAIIVVLAVLLLPSLKKIDFDLLLQRLEVLKVGDVQVKLKTAEQADKKLDSDRISKLRADIDLLQSSIALIQNKVPSAKAGQASLQESNIKKLQLQANSKYKVLVFHQLERKSELNGNKVASALLKAGYVSSDTETDFSELQKIQPTPGLIYITYNLDGAQVLSDVRKRIEELKLAPEVKVNSRAIDLHRGDLQVLVF